MNAFKSAFVRTAVVFAFVLSGCASLTAPDSASLLAAMHDSSQSGGE